MCELFMKPFLKLTSLMDYYSGTDLKSLVYSCGRQKYCKREFEVIQYYNINIWLHLRVGWEILSGKYRAGNKRSSGQHIGNIFKKKKKKKKKLHTLSLSHVQPNTSKNEAKKNNALIKGNSYKNSAKIQKKILSWSKLAEFGPFHMSPNWFALNLHVICIKILPLHFIHPLCITSYFAPEFDCN